MKPDLSINLAGIRMKNPVMTASGTFGYGPEYADLVDLNKLGAMVVKGICLKPTYGNATPRTFETASGLINAIGLPGPGVDGFVKKYMPFLRQYDVPVIVNIWGKTIEEYAEVAERFDAVDGVAGLEVNLSCPNIKEGSAVFAANLDLFRRCLDAVRVKTKKPLIPKLAPNVADIALFAKAAEDCGSDAISLINSFPAMAVDIETRKPRIANVTGGLTGPAIKPIAVRLVWQAAQAVKIPVVGMGGIYSAADAMEFFLVGASAVAVGTVSFTNPDSAVNVIEGIGQYLSKHGHKKIGDAAVGSAMHGDRVLVEVGNIRPDGRGEGRIVRLIGRAHATVVGKFHYGDRRNYVTPIDQKITQEIVIPPGLEHPESPGGEVESSVSSVVKSQPRKAQSHDRVFGKEAARRADLGDLENAVVDVEITDWPTATRNPRGRVVEILGFEEDFGVDVEIMIRKFHLPHRFPSAVLEEAQNAEPIIPATETRKRRDFRSFQIVTIDGETARDFDDAVAVRRLESGNFELQVHIADVAHYVTADSALDQEARLRGTSVYFPDRAVPMLPLELSTDICSLRPKVDRLVMSCVMEIDHHGEILGYDLSEGIIRSAERMTYTDVNAVLEGDVTLRQRYAGLVPGFELMRDLALILNRKRERRGSIDFDLPEPVIEFDEFGLMKSITRSERNIAHRLIEEFMLSANECVASYLENRRIASLYRIHEKPDAKRVYDFEIIAATFGYSLGVGPLPIQRLQLKTDRRAGQAMGKQVRAIEIPKEVHITPRMYQKLTEKIAGKPEERILSFLMLRSLKQARYSEENLGHFALAATAYTHFTSPIRRYPDLIVHRILKKVLGESASGGSAGATKPSPWSKRRDHGAHRESVQPLGGPISREELHEIAEESSQSERRADDAERELMEWKKVKFMQDRVGEDFDGLVISVTKYGFFVELTDLFVEGLVPLDSLTDDRYTYHENTREIIGLRSRRIYSLGQRIRVLVDRIDPVEKKIQFAVLEEKPALKRRKR